MFLSKDSIPPILSQRRLHLCCSAQNASMLSNAALIKKIIPPKKGGKDDCIVIVLYIWTIQNHPKLTITDLQALRSAPRSTGRQCDCYGSCWRPWRAAWMSDVRDLDRSLGWSMDFKLNLREKLWVHPVYIWLWKTMMVSCKFSLLWIKSHHSLMFLLKSQGSLLCAGMSPQSSLD